MPHSAYTVVHAKDASPTSIADALARQRAYVAWGPCGPIGDLPVILIPTDHAAPSPARSVRSVVPIAQATHTTKSLPRAGASRRLDVYDIRAGAYAIGGYAAVFNTLSNDGALQIERGAFQRAMREGMYLFANHPEDAGERPSLASTSRGSLFLQEDDYGLWFEALLPNDAEGRTAFHQVCRGEIAGVSWGSHGGRFGDEHGVRSYTELGVWELSLIAPPHKPRFSGTWVALNGPARRRRRITVH